MESHHVAWPWLWRLVGSKYRMRDWQLRLHHPQRPAWSQSQSSCPWRVDDQMGPWPCDQPSHSQSYRQYRSVRLGKYSCGSILVCLWILSLCCDYGLVHWVFLYDSLGRSGWGVEGWVKSHFIPLTWPDILLSLDGCSIWHPFTFRRPWWKVVANCGICWAERRHRNNFNQRARRTEVAEVSEVQEVACWCMLYLCTVSMYCSCMVISWPHSPLADGTTRRMVKIASLGPRSLVKPWC